MGEGRQGERWLFDGKLFCRKNIPSGGEKKKKETDSIIPEALLISSNFKNMERFSCRNPRLPKD